MSVRDNGIGISHERLMAIQHNLKKYRSRSRNGYGLYNVYRRLLLITVVTYNLISRVIESQGTTISIIVPKKEEPTNVQSLHS